MVCLRYASNREEALDILHDSFIKIYSNIGKFSWRDWGSLKGWLTRLTINMALERLRETAWFRTIADPLPDIPFTGDSFSGGSFSGGPVPGEEKVGLLPIGNLFLQG